VDPPIDMKEFAGLVHPRQDAPVDDWDECA
jgi:hypothetical protein